MGKIRKIWNQTFENEADIANLGKRILKFDAINSAPNELKYESDWILGDIFNNYTVTLEVNFRLAELFIPMIKILPIIKTEEPYQAENNYINLTFDHNYNIFRNEFEEDNNNKFNWYNYTININLNSEVVIGNNIPLYYKIIMVILKDRYFNELR